MTFSNKIQNSLCVAIVALVGSGCSPEPEQMVPVRPVQTQVLQGAGETAFRRFPGEVKAIDSSEMSFDVPGRLVEFPAVQGMVAKQGTLLGRLDDANFQARLDAARADFNNARDELARRRQLRERGVIAQSELEQFQQQFEVAEAALRQSQRAFDDTRMVAPFDGRVARTMVNNFQNLQAKQPVLVFQNNSGFEIDIEVPESDMALGTQGVTAENARDRLEARAEFPAIPGQQFDLVLNSFSTEATRSTRTFRVTFLLQPPTGQNILPGMTSTVLLRSRTPSSQTAPESNAFLLPTSAVSTADGGTWVWVLNPDSMTVSRMSVELVGPTGSGMMVKSASLNMGDEIVTSGVRFLADGMKVSRLSPVNP